MDIIAGVVVLVGVTLGMTFFCWLAQRIAVDDEEE